METKNQEEAQSHLQNQQTSSSQRTTSVTPQPGQKDLQEVKNDEFEQNRQFLQEQTQTFMYSQSSKCSSVSRNVVFGIIGTIWIISFQDGQFNITNRFLFSSLMISLLFLLTDVIHYYTDSRCYWREIWRMDNYKTQDDLDNRHEPIMNQININSQLLFIYKFIFLICSSAYLIIGIFQKYV